MNEQEYQKYSKAQRNYASARYEVLFLIVLTVVNMFALLISGQYFVCSISFATYVIICGTLAKEDPSQFGITEELADSAFSELMITAIMTVALYLLFFFLSKRKRGCLVTLLVFVSVDTLFSLLNIALTSAVLDIIVHIISICVLAKGVSAGRTLENHFAKGVAVKAAEIRGFYDESRKKKIEEASKQAQWQLEADDPFAYSTSTTKIETKQQESLASNCPSCGAPLKSTDKFCSYCGTARPTTQQTKFSTAIRQEESKPKFDLDDDEDLA